MTIDWSLIATKEEINEFYLLKGASIISVAKHLGVSITALSTYMKRAGIQRKPKGHRHPTIMDRIKAISPKELKSMTLHELALELGTDYKTANAYRYLIRNKEKFK